jgi:CheY-like chemotaxis protein/predicted regulator of Ras-like GTPase activity (Roadblock/LC7/MglB family)
MKNVLIIDDEKSLLFSMKAGFESFRNELTVHTAENGAQALKILESTPIDLVVTDLKMPEMDGFEVLSHLNESYPGIHAMVMTAFNTPDIENRLNADRSVTIFEKPVNFDEFSKAILEAVNNDANDGSLGISLSSFMQLIQTEQKTCLLEVSTRETTGHMYFENGELVNAACAGLKGEEAVYRMLELDHPKIGFKRPPQKKIKRTITTNLMLLLMEGMRRIDESKEKAAGLTEGLREDDTPDDTPPETAPEHQGTPLDIKQKGEKNMANIKETLEKFKAVDGFMAAGAFTPNGEMVAEMNIAGVNIAELGALANDVLLKAQKATEIMGVGRGQLVHVEAPKAHIFARCLNESTDYAATAAGRAHVHMILVIEKEGNVAMSKMRIESIIMEVAEHFR